MPTLSNRAYDWAKFITQILLPALGTLYFALADLWSLPNAFQVVGTIMAVDAFLGVLLGLSAAKYSHSEAKYDGSIDMEELEDRKVYSLSLNVDPEELETKKEVTFKVNPSS